MQQPPSLSPSQTASTSSSSYEEMEIIKHFSHKHVLSLREKKREDYLFCQGCYEKCYEGRCYGCTQSNCMFGLHESCAKLPQELNNPSLHPHPLSLHPKHPRHQVKNGEFDCCACGKGCKGFTFRCDKCNVTFDVKCAFIRTAIEKEGEEAVVVGTHFSHPEHPLLLLDKIPADRIICHVCGTYCSDPMTYGCLQCRFFLHQSCFKFPQQIICHPFHPYHPLTLKPEEPLADIVVRCNACRKEIQCGMNKFFYSCEYSGLKGLTFDHICGFRLHKECSAIRPAITYEGHNHLIQFNDNTKNIGDELIKCNDCKSTCESYGFSCLDLHCDFNLHHTCGPLPYSIKHKSHIHPLILTNFPAQHEHETDDEFYCDACEEERPDPLLRIYQCIECHFAADIKCLTSEPEVISSLNGEYGDVVLINPLGQFGKVIITKDATKEMAQTKEKKQLESTLTWDEVLGTLVVDENENEVLGLFDDRIREITSTARWIEPYDHEEIIMFCDNACTDFLEFVEHDENWSYDFPYGWDIFAFGKVEVVNVGDYMTTRRLAPISNHLLSNHGDIGAESTLNPRLRSFYFCMLCECIERMRNTKVVDITIGMLLGWWRCLKIVQFAGFKIEFAFDRLKRVTHAHFGLFVEKQVNNIVDQIEKSTRKLEYIKSAKSSLIEECLREASVLKKEKAVPSRLL